MIRTDHRFEEGPERLPSGLVNWLLASVAYAVAGYLPHLSWWFFFIIGALIGWRFLLEIRGYALPPAWTRIVLITLLIAILLFDQQTLWGRDAGVPFLIGLLGIKLLELQTTRDFIFVSFLCYFLVVGALLFSQTIFMCFYLLGVMVVSTAGLVGLQVGREAKTMPRSIYWQACKLLIQALPLALLLFVCIPRVEGRMAFQMGQITTGLSDSMQPGDIARLHSDDRVAFRAEFTNHVVPKTANLYWRGIVLWETDGMGWFIGRRPRRPKGVSPEKPSEGEMIEQRITLMPNAQNWMVGLDFPIRGPAEANARAGNVFESHSRIYRKLQYTITSRSGVFPTEMSDGIERMAIQLPMIPTHKRRQAALPQRVDPRLIELVGKWRSQSTDPDAIAQKALKYFHDEGFRYTLNPGRYRGENPLAEFIFDRKQGFCDHYASAFTFLMRLAGVHSRVVTGFLGGDYNPYGGFMVVRQLHSHAWSEVWIPGKGWMRVDPTAALAADHIDPGLNPIRATGEAAFNAEASAERLGGPKWAPKWLRKTILNASLATELCEDSWDRWVVSYDVGVQESLMRRLGLDRLGWLAIASLVMVSSFATIRLVGLRSKRRDRKKDRVKQLYESFCSNVSRAGVPPQIWEGPLDFTQRAAKALPAHGLLIEEVGRLYAQLRYGSPGLASATSDQLAGKIRNLRAELVLVQAGWTSQS